MVGAYKVTNILKQGQLLKEANWRTGYQWIRVDWVEQGPQRFESASSAFTKF